MATDVLPEVPELPAVGLPAELLEQRPDIRASWRQVDAAGWGVAVAKADRLPAIRLTADGGYGAEELSDLFDNWAANLFAGLTAPLLDGGRRRAEVRRTQAVWEERVGKYREVVVNALREVEDGLVRSQGVEERIEILRGELRVAGETKVEAVRRYKKGVTDYLPVLQSLLSEQKLERNMLGVERDLRKERVALYRALGGDWTGSWREEIEDGENNE